MASPLTQNVARIAIPNVAQLTQSHHPRSLDQINTHSQNVEQIQRTAHAQINNPKVQDRDRSPQIPKRVETTYSSKGLKKKPARPSSARESDEEQVFNHGLDLKA